MALVYQPINHATRDTDIMRGGLGPHDEIKIQNSTFHKNLEVGDFRPLLPRTAVSILFQKFMEVM